MKTYFLKWMTVLVLKYLYVIVERLIIQIRAPNKQKIKYKIIANSFLFFLSFLTDVPYRLQ